MHFYVPAKAGERPGDKAQSAPRYGYRKRCATQWPGLSPAFPKGVFAPALAALRRLCRRLPARRAAPRLAITGAKTQRGYVKVHDTL